MSSFDIARLVAPVRAEREARARQRAADKGSIIGSLIEEVLFEFTSLQGGGGSDSGGDRSSVEMGASPLNLGSFDTPQDWTAEIGLDSPSSRGAHHGPGSFEVGNLAALEDDTASGRRNPQSTAPQAELVPRSQPVPSSRQMGQSGQQRGPGSVPQPSAPPPVPAKSGGKGGVIAIFLVLLLIAGVVGAYFAGLIPPELIQRFKH